MSSKRILLTIGILLTVSVVGNVCLAVALMESCKSKEICFDNYSNSVFALSIEKEQNYNFATCFCYSSNGLFVTNYHPIKAVDENIENMQIIIVDSSSNTHNATLIGVDIQQDIAIISCKDLFASPVRTCDKSPKLGEKCYSFGNANGLGVTLYDGIISNPNIRLVVDGLEQSYIQAKNDVYPGCSGGCLLNNKGYFIGMVSFRTKDKDGNPVKDFSYSIPTNTISTVVKNITKQ